MNKPSSTISAAALSGSAMVVFWELMMQFSAIEWRATLVAGSVVFVSSLVGYFKKENVLQLKDE